MNNQLIVLTGSHLTPALAVTAKLKSAGYRVKSLKVPAPKFNRHQPLRSTLSFIKLPWSIVQAKKQLQALKPRLVVSFGGYQALPVCLAAKKLHLPLLIHEQTFTIGLTSRLTGRLADLIAVSWPETIASFPRLKTRLTGNLLRQEILSLRRQPKSYSRPLLYITGGHFGSQTLNQTITPILSVLLKRFEVYHQFGLHQSEVAFRLQQKVKSPYYHLKPWFETPDLVRILAQADLVISRSGINTVSELAYLKIPAVLIPLTTAQKNEQLTNAQFLRSLGLALILPQAKLTPQTLLTAINQALKTLPQRSRQQLNSRLLVSASDKFMDLINTLVTYEAKTN